MRLIKKLQASTPKMNIYKNNKINKMWADIFQGLGNGVPRPIQSINCSPNGIGGVRCQ